jgi:hypothetical protein
MERQFKDSSRRGPLFVKELVLEAVEDADEEVFVLDGLAGAVVEVTTIVAWSAVAAARTPVFLDLGFGGTVPP